MDRTTVLPSLVEWCRDAATPILSADGRLLDIAADTTGRLFRSIDAADIVFLGETNHFVHQKTQFRQLCLQSLALHWPLVIGEELSWSDGHRVSEFLAHGDDAALTRTATFSPRGQSGYQRADRDDSPQGILGRSAYPDQLMLAEHTRLYQALRAIGGISDYFGFDIYGPSSAYEDIDLSGTSALSLPQVFREGFPRVPQESLSAEVSRLERLVASLSGDDPVHADVLTHVLPLIDSLRYSALVRDAANYEATRPAMAYREDAMKRLVKRKLDQLQPGQKLVLMGHAFHLAKNDVHVEGPGIGPGGGEVSSLGHYLTQELGRRVTSLWMLYGQGIDSQPLTDLPQRSRYPEDSINRRLASLLPSAAMLPLTEAAREALTSVSLGHLYNQTARVALGNEADAIVFFPEVTPLQPRNPVGTQTRMAPT